MKKTITYITTADTKKTYEYPPKEGVKNPTLNEVLLTYDFVDESGRSSPSNRCTYNSTSIFLERESLERAGILPIAYESEVAEVTETAEDLILRLLEMVDVHPNE